MTNGQSPSKTSPQKQPSSTKPETQPATSATSNPAASNSNEKSKPILLNISPEIVQFVTTPDYKEGIVIHLFISKNLKDLEEKLRMGTPGAIYRVTNVQMTLEKLDPIPATDAVNANPSPTPPTATTPQA